MSYLNGYQYYTNSGTAPQDANWGSYQYVSLDDIVNKTDVPNLDVVSAGVVPPNPSELIGSEKMKVVIEKMKDEYDIVLFDTPPLVAVTDAFILIKHKKFFL